MIYENVLKIKVVEEDWRFMSQGGIKNNKVFVQHLEKILYSNLITTCTMMEVE